MIMRLPAAFRRRAKCPPETSNVVMEPTPAQIVSSFSRALTLKERSLTQGADIVGIAGEYPDRERDLQAILNNKRLPTETELSRMLAFVRDTA